MPPVPDESSHAAKRASKFTTVVRTARSTARRKIMRSKSPRSPPRGTFSTTARQARPCSPSSAKCRSWRASGRPLCSLRYSTSRYGSIRLRTIVISVSLPSRRSAIRVRSPGARPRRARLGSSSVALRHDGEHRRPSPDSLRSACISMGLTELSSEAIDRAHQRGDGAGIFGPARGQAQPLDQRVTATPTPRTVNSDSGIRTRTPGSATAGTPTVTTFEIRSEPAAACQRANRNR